MSLPPPPPSLMLTSLLNSLHTHLQSQTQLLPTLHIQLGLPPTALEDELKTIEQHLMQSVEDSINTRRKQVEQWLEKCELLEHECVQYTKALGGNVKSAGTSVAELKKEQALPKRYEFICSHQEKLRQLYHTKLEQLMTLTTRLKNLSRTLGHDFFSQDILNSTSASGRTDHPSSALLELTPERFSRLEKELVRGKGEIAKRLSQLSTAFLQIDWLYAELGMPPASIDALPCPSRHQSRSASSSSSTLPDPFLSTSLSTPTPASRMLTPSAPLLCTTPDEPPATPSGPSELDCQRVFAQFVARIEDADPGALAEGSTLGLEGVEPHAALLRWAERTRAALEDSKRRREAHIQAMYDQLEALWRRLGVGEVDMDGFVEAHRGSTEETVRAYEEELERMLELKRERMGVFIANAREEIEKLWDDLMVGEEERLDFAPFADDEHTEELLSIHEAEIVRLKEERKMKSPLLASIKKFFDICDEEKQLAAAASDQTRLLGRGVRGDPGRLLKEEKMRKRVNKEKPRLERDLLISIPAWEAEIGQTFFVYGESILKMLMETVGVPEQENLGSGGSKRKNGSSGPSRSSSTRSATSQYVPGLGVKGSGPAAYSSNSLSSSNKRPRLGDSTGPAPSRPPSRSGAPAPLSVSRANGTVSRPASPTKGRKPPSSLPRPVVAAAAGTRTGYAQRAASNLAVPPAMRIDVDMSAMAKKATRARKESFKPRPSVDAGPLATWRHNGETWGPSTTREHRY